MNIAPSEMAGEGAGKGGGMASGRAIMWVALGILLTMFTAISPASAGAPTVTAANPESSVAATPALVRQIQFMLLSIGIDPGPIDGVPRQLTNAAVHKFEQQSGLPEGDLVSGVQISTGLLDSLRKAASGVLLGTQPQPPAVGLTPAPPATPQPAVAAAPPRIRRPPLTASPPAPSILPTFWSAARNTRPIHFCRRGSEVPLQPRLVA
jgi:peptidoglycan hydrolase-like protein with peptidoglycan-binding domain